MTANHKNILFKSIIIFFCSFIIFVIIARPANAQFKVDAEITYLFDKNGAASVFNHLTLTNEQATVYAKSFSMLLDNFEPLNVSGKENSNPLIITASRLDNHYQLKANFASKTVGAGVKKQFDIDYQLQGLAAKTGEVWEVNIPKLAEENAYYNYRVILKIPNEFGQKAYLTPDPFFQTNDQGYSIFTFNKEQLQSGSIAAGFGQFQSFLFKLNYHLENPLKSSAETTIALPPDTSFQKMFYQSIEPNPNTIETDSDGNWLAKYLLKPRERIDVTATGFVQIYATAYQNISDNKDILNNNLKETYVWQTTDPFIIALKNKLKSAGDVYQYVVDYLSYDYRRVKPNVSRLGASQAITNPQSAICTEYTDLFIAIARSIGIPAREVNGYAYTDNPEIKPLSLVADVLHAWPEYWDDQKKIWVPVDPTWGDTTGGIDFFNKLDLRHFTFVIHGSDPDKPYPAGSYKLGSNPDKDIFINFGRPSQVSPAKLEVSAKLSSTLTFFNRYLKIKVKNYGPPALYQVEAKVRDHQKLLSTRQIKSLLPFTETEIIVQLPFAFLGFGSANNYQVLVNNQNITVKGDKNINILMGSVVSLFFLFIVLLLFLKTIKKIDLMAIIKNKLRRK